MRQAVETCRQRKDTAVDILLFWILEPLLELVAYLIWRLIEAGCKLLLSGVGRMLRWCGVRAWQIGSEQIQAYQEQQTQKRLNAELPQRFLLRGASQPATADLLRPAADVKPTRESELLRIV